MRAMDTETASRNTLPGHTRTLSGGKPAPEGLAILHAKIALNQDLAQREMRLTDRSERQRSPSWDLGRSMAVDKVTLDEESDELRIELMLDGIGVSLIDQEPRELLHASLQQLKVVAVRTPQQHSLSLALAHLQVPPASAPRSTARLAPARSSRVTLIDSRGRSYPLSFRPSPTSRRWIRHSQTRGTP